MTFKLAWRNLWRRSRRTLFGVIAVAAASIVVVFLPSLQAGSYASMIRTYTGFVDGYAQIQRPGYLETPAMRESFLVDDKLSAALTGLPENISFAERGIAYSLLSSPSRSIGAEIMGVDPKAEPAVSKLPDDVVAGSYLSATDQVMLGETLARNLNVGVGDSITLLGVGRDGSLAADVLTVAGIFRSGLSGLDRQLAQMSLDRFDTTFTMEGQRHEIVLNGDDSAALRNAVAELGPVVAADGLTLRDWTELEPGLYSAIELDITTGLLMYGVLIAVVVVSLLNTLLMSVLERTREFGMMMALGVKPGRLGRIVWSEIGLMALLGAAAGIALGAVITVVYAHRGITVESAQAIFQQFGMSATMYPELIPLTALLGPAIIVVAILAAGIYPALRIRRLRIVESMRAA